MEITNRFTESGDELCKRKACRTLSDVLESEEFRIGCGDLSIFLGINDPGKPIMEDLSECNHLLVTGENGVGKHPLSVHCYWDWSLNILLKRSGSSSSEKGKSSGNITT